ncbi:MAG TPA: hypothetical protein VGN57_12345 [Pirellulaceae bacterium]|jgi:hypothetical protein|nr:hypothetical protein [Pirellulaceae bacterium]
MKLAWKTPTLASAAYAGRALRRGERTDAADVSTSLVREATDFQAALRQTNLPTAKFWDELVAWSALAETRRAAVERTIRRSAQLPFAPFDLTLEFDGRFGRIERELATLRPRLGEELPLRVRPIREAWETVGPGLLRSVENLTEPGLLVGEATVVVVHPFTGGGGSSHLATDSVAWEGMLAHPHPELPETLRLAWMLSQLGLDVPRYEQELEEEDVERIAALAMLPATLAAGEELELVRCDEATVARALELWGLLDSHRERAAEALLAWWDAYQERRPPWETALVALEQIMPVA